MAKKRSTAKDQIHYHKDGTIWAKGQMIDGVATGYWEWFRKDGSKMRSGHFKNGEQVGEWTTYDRQSRVFKVTNIKPNPKTDSKLPTKSKSPAGSKQIDGYIDGLPDDQRAALQKLRETIHAAVPTAEECISYQLPAFRLGGKVLVLFGAAKQHCTFYPGSGTAVKEFLDELKDFKTSKGAIQFQPDATLPVGLVRKILKYRIAENAADKPRAQKSSARRS